MSVCDWCGQACEGGVAVRPAAEGEVVCWACGSGAVPPTEEEESDGNQAE